MKKRGIAALCAACVLSLAAQAGGGIDNGALKMDNAVFGKLRVPFP
jgi:hypothetical protein